MVKETAHKNSVNPDTGLRASCGAMATACEHYEIAGTCTKLDCFYALKNIPSAAERVRIKRYAQFLSAQYTPRGRTR